MERQQHSFGILLLAAGGSSRMGTPKQLLKYKGVSLLRRAVREAMLVKPDSISVVLGAGAMLIKDEIKDLGVRWVTNDQYREGIASSIRCGLQSLLEQNTLLQSVIIMVCDQPHVQAGHLQRLLGSYHSSDASIVASDYAEIRGVPALFDKSLFPELMLLKGDRGARALIERHKESIIGVDFPLGKVDVDTIEDYQKLNGKLIDKGCHD